MAATAKPCPHSRDLRAAVAFVRPWPHWSSWPAGTSYFAGPVCHVKVMAAIDLRRKTSGTLLCQIIFLGWLATLRKRNKLIVGTGPAVMPAKPV